MICIGNFKDLYIKNNHKIYTLSIELINKLLFTTDTINPNKVKKSIVDTLIYKTTYEFTLYINKVKSYFLIKDLIIKKK